MSAVNTELLRDDEKIWYDAETKYPSGFYMWQVFTRLIEERENSKHGEEMYVAMRDRCAIIEAELAEARKDSARFKWLLRRTRFGTKESIDAAMKEGK